MSNFKKYGIVIWYVDYFGGNMKVLLINHFPLVGSGSGVYVENIAKCLRDEGHEVCIIMPEKYY